MSTSKGEVCRIAESCSGVWLLYEAVEQRPAGETMLRKALLISLILLALPVAYLLTWPVGIEPVIWQVPPNPGYAGIHAENQRLSGVETFALGDNEEPEDLAVDNRGRIYAATRHGRIVRLQPDATKPEV